MRVDGERSVKRSGAGAHHLARRAAFGKTKPFETDEDNAAEAVVDLSEVNLRRCQACGAPQVARKQARVVARVVLPHQCIAHIQTGSRAARVGTALNHRQVDASARRAVSTDVTRIAHAPSTSLVQSAARNGSATNGES